VARHEHGIGVSPGVAYGPVLRLAPPPVLPPPGAGPGDAEAELAAARAGLERVGADLESRAASAPTEAAEVLGALAMIVRDPELADEVESRIRDGAAAPHAVAEAFDQFAAVLASAGGYLGERAADLADLRERAVAVLLGRPMPGVPNPDYTFVLVAGDLAPADTAVLDTKKVLAIVTELGGPTSHTAILSKSLGLPAVVRCAGADALLDGDLVLVDGSEGEVVVDPPPSLVAEHRARAEGRRAAAAGVRGPGRTADGHPVKLLVNIGSERDLEQAATADAEGVGLFRTEFLFLDRAEAPTLAEQTAVYAKVFSAFAGRRVVVRTLDAGADKPLAFLPLGAEANPALGIRGLRTARRAPELLAVQLRAIAAAADVTAQAGRAGPELWVMAPMVSTASEARAFCAQVHQAGIATGGVMVEVPAAALRADEVLAGCDFASLGTNDLAQYTFAADRMQGDLADLLDPWQPALLELIRLTAQAGARAGKPVGVCGEAASDPALALILVGLGVSSLSMAPVSLDGVRAALARVSLARCQELAGMALASPDATSARVAVYEAAGLS
jgi:phosphotransferase system enzyme I (PtsI)